MYRKKSNPFHKLFLSFKNRFSSGAKQRRDEKAIQIAIQNLLRAEKNVLLRFGTGEIWLSEEEPALAELHDKKIIVQTSDFLTANPGCDDPADYGHYYRINPRYEKLIRQFIESMPTQK